MGTFEFDGAHASLPPPARVGAEGLAEAVLEQNARWFTKVRWGIIAVVSLAALVSRVRPDILRWIGLELPTRWLWGVAGSLTLTNALFHLHLHRLQADDAGGAARVNISLQILTDMLVVTALVHSLGSTLGFFPFVYLFHIALACIFFSRKGSFLVTLLAASLYMACVLVETAWLEPHISALIDARHMPPPTPRLSLLLAGSSIGIWFVVWYLVSTISIALRRRDLDLAIANESLRQADREKTRQVLRVTHDLKAPFTGIESNIQILRFQHWAETPDAVRALIDRIQARAQTLSARIRDILTLGDFQARPHPAALEPVDLRAVMQQVVDGLQDAAAARRVELALQVPPLRVLGEAKPLAILFTNLVSNAIFYSHEGTRVDIQAATEGDEVRVGVRDRGIGIGADALPRIFDEFYRTKEAVKFNRLSTGLGLPIVGAIVRDLGLRIRVSSEEGKGTLVEVFCRRAGEADEILPVQKKGTSDG